MKRESSKADVWAVGWAMRALVFLAVLTAFLVPAGMLNVIAVGTVEDPDAGPVAGIVQIPLSSPEPTPAAELVTPTPHVTRVGVIAGHSGSDSGAICPDGLQEVDINRNVARRVVALLSQRGWNVDLLEEFDPQLNGYLADALVSIHADSCNVPGKSGFKVARVESSFQLGPEDRLVRCISEYYQERTGLEFDSHTITFDMTRYHAYYEIDRNTPAAIIEIGFLLDDRELLTQRPEVVAQGIVDGIICFVEGEE